MPDWGRQTESQESELDEETNGKLADAAKEIAKTTGTALELVKSAGGFLHRLVGESLEELGQSLTDRIRIWRMRNLLAAAQKAQATASQLSKPIEFRALPEGDAVRWLEGAAAEDDPDLQQLWAQLLLNAADQSHAARIDKVVVDILRQLMPLDAKIAEFLGQQGWSVFQNVSGGFSVGRIANELHLSEPDVWRSISNLWRLGCLLLEQRVEVPTLPGASQFSSHLGAVHDKGATYRLSPIGTALLESVKPKL
jgi:hypothetical protein